MRLYILGLLYLGLLDPNDSLYDWLVHEIFPQVGLRQAAPRIIVYCLNASNQVFVYEVADGWRRVRVVGKFYGYQGMPETEKYRLLTHEFANLQRARALGFESGPYRVIRPLGYNRAINYVIVVEYAWGRRLDSLVVRAAQRGRSRSLLWALSELAHFLYLLHVRGEQTSRVDFDHELHYFEATLSRLVSATHLSDRTVHSLREKAYKWRESPLMWSSQSCLVHGDCTPSNFILAADPHVTAIDFERYKVSDPVFDTGRLAAELKHDFMTYAGSAQSSEPFITHLYREYASHSGYPTFFDDVTRRNPFYQAVTELRIAKNYWVTPDHRAWLIREALSCLGTVP